MIIIAGGNERRRASVFDLVRIRMNALVQLRRSTQGERPKKSRGSEDRDRSTADRAAFH